MNEQTFEKGQLILATCFGGPWHIYQYFGENDERIFILGGFLSKKNNEIIPYEGNEHLLGTTDSPKPKWQPKPGELVAVSDDKKVWFAQVFIGKERGRYEGEYESSDTHDSSQPTYWQYCEPLCEHFNVPEVE